MQNDSAIKAAIEAFELNGFHNGHCHPSEDVWCSNCQLRGKALAGLKALALSESWQDISTAPRDGELREACGNCGAYESFVIVKMPDNWDTQRATRYFQVDACIWPEVSVLIKAGIRTIESCCGHGGSEGYIAVDESDAGAMEIRGYWRIEGKPGFYRPLEKPIHVSTLPPPPKPLPKAPENEGL